jgi:3-methylcrotonyl-CoA carboxylase beta subunit
MARIESQLSTTDPGFAAARDGMATQVSLLNDRLAQIRQMGPEEARTRHTSRGKLLARDRVAALMDPATPFLEFSPLAAWNCYGGDVPSAALVAGIIRIHGRECVVLASDATVKGGTFFPLTVKKLLRAQEIARENCLLTVHMVDSGGAFLPLQSEIFPDKEHGGRVFYEQARLSAAGVPQVAIVMGSCTAGGAYTPAMAEQVIIVEGSGSIFLAGPPLVRAATGEVVSAEELGGADVHTRISGLADYMVGDDASALRLTRELVLHAGTSPAEHYRAGTVHPPAYDGDELRGLAPSAQARCRIKEIVARLVDASEFSEFKPRYGANVLTGFAHLAGFPIGIAGSEAEPTVADALKVAHFVQMCTERRIPLVFLEGGLAATPLESPVEAITARAKLLRAVAVATVPKFSLLLGGTFTPEKFLMCGRSMGPRMLWLWPGASAGMDQEGTEPSYQSTARMWDDGIIDPAATRSTLALALAACRHAPIGDAHWGPFRM